MSAGLNDLLNQLIVYYIAAGVVVAVGLLRSVLGHTLLTMFVWMASFRLAQIEKDHVRKWMDSWAYEFDQDLGQLELWRGVEEIRHLVDEAGLLAYRRHDGGMGVADVQNGPAGGEVQIRFAIVIEHTSALGANQNHRAAIHDLHVVLGFQRLVFRRTRHVLFPL